MSLDENRDFFYFNLLVEIIPLKKGISFSEDLIKSNA